MRDLTKIFKALSDPNRIRILKMLEVRPLCVCEITTILGLATSTVSKHLSILREAGFIFDQKEKKWVYYYLNRATHRKYVRELMAILEKGILNDPVVVKDKKKVEQIDQEIVCRA